MLMYAKLSPILERAHLLLGRNLQGVTGSKASSLGVISNVLSSPHTSSTRSRTGP